jgi:integration host factor subunit beta
MVRFELVRSLCAQYPHYSADEISKVVDMLFDSIVERLAQGGRVELRGFGAFSSRHRGARIGRNPRSGASVEVVPKRVVYFKPGKEMRQRLNS